MSELSKKIAFGFHKIGLAIRHGEWDAGFKNQLTPTQAKILSILQEARPDKRIRAKDVASEMGVSMPTAVESIQALCRKGLIRKEPSQQDKREKFLLLLPKGKVAAKQADEGLLFLQQAIESLDTEDQAVLLKGMITIVRELQKQNKLSVAHMCVSCEYFEAYAHKGAAYPHHCHYVDLPFGTPELHIECPDYEAAKNDIQEKRLSTSTR